jgi:uncharacterized membrane protein (TIGR02234 family)
MTAGRERLGVLLLGVAGAGLALLTAGRTWLDVVVSDPLVGNGRLFPDGRAVASVVPAAALVGLAGVVAAVTMRRVGRFVAGFLLVVAGAAIGAASVSVLLHPRSAAADTAGAATGRTGDVHAVAAATATAWPWIAVAAAGPLVLAGAVTLVRGRGWSGLSSRYDALGAGALPEPPDDGGVDPRVAPSVDPAVDPDIDPEQRRAADDDAAAEAWDAVSRGEDPTS